MSAFMVNKGTIDQLVYLSEVPEEERNKTGQMLVNANKRSMAARYGKEWDHHYGGWHRKPYRYSSHERHATPAEGIMLIRCLNYQSCEYDGWERSKAKRFLLELMWSLACQLEEVRETDMWGWPE